MLKAKLVRKQYVTPDLLRMWLQVVDGETDKTIPFPFKPGQYCTLGMEGIERAYSIVSAPHETELEIFVELTPDGALTSLIWEKLNEGDYMSIRQRAKGLFLLDERAHHHFMIATVTGVAPYISMIRHHLQFGGPGHKFYVLLGASYQDELTYDAELAGLAREYPDSIIFVPTVSRPNEERNVGWEGAEGRVNLIAQEHLAIFNPPKADTVIYACGHPGMIEDIKDRFSPNGWKVQEERFWKE